MVEMVKPSSSHREDGDLLAAAERNYLRSRSYRKNHRLLHLRDLVVGGMLLVLWPVAWLVPEGHWPRFTLLWADVHAWLRPQSVRNRSEDLMRKLGETHRLPPPRELDRYRMAGEIGQFLQYLREWRPGGWHPRIELTGREHYDRVLTKGRPVVLWVAPFLYSELMAKKALHAAGILVTYAGGYHHGPSTSRLGRVSLCRVQSVPELRYLGERIDLLPGVELPYLRRLEEAVRGGAPVAFSTAPIGKRCINATFVARASLTLPTGAPSLALATGGVLLPVITLRHPDGVFEVRIEPALEAPAEGDRHTRIGALIDAWMDVLRPHVLNHPRLFREWWELGGTRPIDAHEILKFLENDLHEVGVANGRESLQLDTGLFGQGVGLDSMEILQLVSRMEKRLSITIEDNELDESNFRTAGDFVRLIVEKQS